MADQILDESLVTTHDTPSASPFLLGTHIQYAWDSTSLGLFKTCPRLYQYTMIDGWSSRSESIHLRFGAEYHLALEQYDRSRALGVRHEDAIHDTIRELVIRTEDYETDEETKAGKYKTRDNLIGLVIDYLDHFGQDDPAKTYIKADGDPAVELSFRFELDWGPIWDRDGWTASNLDLDENGKATYSQPYILCGHLDRVVEFNDQLFTMDRKTTTTTISPYYFKQYEPNNQMTLYTLAGTVVLGAPIKGVIIDAAQILLEKPHAFARGFTYRTSDQIDEWLVDLRVTLQLAEQYATNNHWPMNDTACDKFGGCRFREICSKSPGVREQFLKADFVQLEESDRWNPLKAR